MFKFISASIACAALLMSAGAVAGDRHHDSDEHDRGDRNHDTQRACYPGDTVVISATGVKSTVQSPCTRGTVSLSVSGQSNPWDQALNPTMIYTPPGDVYPPLVVSLSTYTITPGAYIALRCSGGTTNAGGLPATGCNGLAGFGFPPTDTMWQPACNSYYPSYYIDPSNYPMYVFDVIGVFTTASGVVVGKPFFVPPSTVNVLVPPGAAQLQLGMNDCLNHDNSPDPLTVQLTY
jgi:hypothetical protein